MPLFLFLRYQCSRIIGDTYTVPDNALLDPKTQASVRVPVWHRGDSLDAYTIIRAQPPRSGRFWVDGVEVRL